MENFMSPENIQVLAGYGPIILMALVFYFLLWRPQKKQQQQRNEMTRHRCGLCLRQPSEAQRRANARSCSRY
jgi:type II secretory pathway component PulM